MRPEQALLRGPALAAVLKLLEREPQSGHQLVVHLRAACPAALALGDASLLALLYYLEAHRLISSQWTNTDRGRRKVYALTDHGRHRLSVEVVQWQALEPLLHDKIHAVDDTGRRAPS